MDAWELQLKAMEYGKVQRIGKSNMQILWVFLVGPIIKDSASFFCGFTIFIKSRMFLCIFTLPPVEDLITNVLSLKQQQQIFFLCFILDSLY